eukprot:817528_1
MLSFIFCLLLIYVSSMPIPKDHQSRSALLKEAQEYNKTNTFIGLGACRFHSWKQCDSAWGNDKLGTGGGQTICSAGCAMTSVANMLGHYNVSKNPGELNQWLDSHNGYASGDLIIWSSVDSLGNPHPSYMGQEHPTSAELQDGIKACHGLIANVRSG